MDTLIETIKMIKKNQKIYILLKNNKIVERKFICFAQEFFSNYQFLVLEFEREEYDEDSFFGDGRYTVPEKEILYISKINKIFLSENDKNEFFENKKRELKNKQRTKKGYAVYVRFYKFLEDEETGTLYKNYSFGAYVYFSEKKYNINDEISINGSSAVIEKIFKTTYGELEDELNKNSYKKIELVEI